MKIAGSAYPGSASIYSGGMSSEANHYGASFTVADATPVANLANVVLQIEIAPNAGFDFFDGTLPILNYNGGSQAIEATLAGITGTDVGGSFGGSTTDTNLYLLQWDLSSEGGISDFEITFSNVQHAQIYAMQLDQSDSYLALPASLVPEPSSTALASIAGLATLLIAGRRCTTRHR